METVSPAPSVVTEVTAEDYFRFAWSHNFHESSLRRRVWGSYVVAVAGMTWNLSYQIPASLAALAGVAMACAAPFLYRWHLRYEASRTVRAAPENYGMGSMQLLPEGIHERSDLGVVTLAWTAVKRIVVTPEVIYFYRGQHTALIVPRRCFASPEAADAFVATARQYHAAATGSRS